MSVSVFYNFYRSRTAHSFKVNLVIRHLYAFPFSLMYLLFCTDFYIFRNFVFFVFLVVQYRRSVIYKIKRLDTNAVTSVTTSIKLMLISYLTYEMLYP